MMFTRNAGYGRHAVSGLSALAAALLLSGTAIAADVDTGDDTRPFGMDYFVRPHILYGPAFGLGEIIDGIEVSGATSRSEGFNNGWIDGQSHVDLKTGTIKNYVSMHGPDSYYLITSGIMGEVITYTGSADVPVSFDFYYSAEYWSDLTSLGDPDFYDSNFAGVEAFFAIYEANSDAYWESWTYSSEFADQALYNGHDLDFVNVQEGSDGMSFDNWLGADLYLQPGKSYKVFASFGLILSPGDFFEGEMLIDALHTSTIDIYAPGGSFTSLSGEFLGFAKTPDPEPPVPGIPEPSTWAMLIAGFGLVGLFARRRERMATGSSAS